MAPGKSSLHSGCDGEQGNSLESWQQNQASRRIEGGISKSFSTCGWRPWVPSICDGDLRDLLMVPMGSQEYYGVRKILSGLHWDRSNGRRPHLELRLEPQGSSPVLTWISGCLCHFKQGLKSRLVWRH